MRAPVPLPDGALALSRWAGLVYLVIILCGLSGELAVRGVLVVPGDAAATAARIAADPGLFRVGILLDLGMLVADVTLAVLLFLLFRPVGEGLALAAAAFRLIQAAVLGANLMHLMAALDLVTGPAGALEAGARAELALVRIGLHAQGYDLGLVFFAVTCGALGVLLRRSGWFPAVLAVLVWAAAGVYALGGLVRVLAPEAIALVQPLYGICILAELAFCLWLIRGPRAAQGVAEGCSTGR